MPVRALRIDRSIKCVGSTMVINDGSGLWVALGYQRERVSIMGLGLKSGEIIETERLVVVARCVLFCILRLICSEFVLKSPFVG